MSWRTNGTRIERENGDTIAYMTPWSTEADALKIAAADDLLGAAKLAALHFMRNRNSGTFQGDDEHEAWSALERAIVKAGG